ncbi:MAG: hypothetical protein IJS88_00470 [Alphaproteobacteria bacterium]|nr:hypothetical protein [Alphaproteobacteria bacterium]
MKRIFCFFCALCAVVMSLSAQKFFEITKIQKLSETEFKISAGHQELRLNPVVYNRVANAPSAYVLAVYTGEKASMITVVRKADIQYVVTEVVSVEKKEDKWSISLSGGKFDIYTSSNPDWETVQPGQHVAYCTFVGETKALAVKPHVVSREVALTDNAPISPAPTAPIIILDKENKIIGVNL